jgi:hypothetical protein
MNSALLTIRETAHMGQALFTLTAIEAGTIIHKCRGSITSTPGVHTLQIAEDKHLVVADSAQYLSHSCDPNCRIIISDQGFDVLSVRSIPAHTLLSFNYLTTEWDMQAPFHCVCGATGCLGFIRGFKHASPEAQALWWKQCSEVVQRMAGA